MNDAMLHERSIVLFDLDNTLFDHRYSLARGIAAIREAYPETLGVRTADELTKAHVHALEQVFRDGMRAGVPASDLASQRTRSFLARLSLAGQIDPRELAERYDAAYLADRRATSGSVELIARLRDAGWRVGIVTDGRRSTQLEKAHAIDLRPLVDALVTSEDAGATKPDPRLFALAASGCCGALDDAVMIGDDVARDVRGALDAGAAAIHYAPSDTVEPSPRGVPVIRHMAEAMALLGVAPAPLRTGAQAGERVVGIDLVTVPRHCSSYARAEAMRLWDRLAAGLAALEQGTWTAALPALADALEIVVAGARILDAARVEIHVPGRDGDTPSRSASARVETRSCSLRCERRVAVSGDAHVEAVLDHVQVSLEALMRDHPRAAARALRAAILIVGGRLGVLDRICVAGEGIDAA